ncbi:ABATE domain-containing protein [Kribbella sp. HUAS MG21]|uniref:ABATE domain-containing protein n=1 Tax=Kribbella sp. HUAS MG21 TaxID=3160966 RepID=A0AAU7TQ91_9ACTN
MTALALALATTIKHDGHGGIADLLSTEAEAVAWLAGQQHLLAPVLGAFDVPSAELHRGLIGMRRAVRALFARAVAPNPPSKADADRLLDVESALRMVNEAADRLGAPTLEWPADSAPGLRWTFRTEDPLELLLGAIGRSTIDFLVSPDRARLRACPAARCVKYFLQDDPRQTWCTPACGNRERVNRHYRKRTAG